MVRTISAACILITLMAAQAGAGNRTGRQLTAGEKIYGLSLIWMEAKYNFVFFDQVPDLDWDKTYKDFIPQVLNSDNRYSYYRILQRFAALLKDGHTTVNFPPGLAAEYVDFPEIRIQAVGRRAIVSDIAARLESDIPIGSEILSIDGVPTENHLHTHVFPYIGASREEILWILGMRGMRSSGVGLLAGPPGSKARIGIETPDGVRRTVQLIRNRSANEDRTKWVFGEKTRVPFELETLANDIVLVRLNSFGDEAVVKKFSAALPVILNARGVILDLRQNSGGNSVFGYAIASHFMHVPLKTSKYRTREHVAAYKAWGQLPDIVPGILGKPMTAVLQNAAAPYLAYGRMDAWREGEPDIIRPAKDGIVKAPVAVLVGPGTGSAAEDMVVLLDPVPNVTFVGAPTYGSTGQQVWLRLPGGGAARICAKRDTFADGRDFVGPGVQPDIFVTPSVEDIRTGRDSVLIKAVETVRAVRDRPAAN